MTESKVKPFDFRTEAHLKVKTTLVRCVSPSDHKVKVRPDTSE